MYITTQCVDQRENRDHEEVGVKLGVKNLFVSLTGQLIMDIKAAANRGQCLWQQTHAGHVVRLCDSPSVPVLVTCLHVTC